MSNTTKAGAGPLGGTGCVAAEVHANLVAPQLVAAALQRGEGVLSEDGALVVRTGSHTEGKRWYQDNTRAVGAR